MQEGPLSRLCRTNSTESSPPILRYLPLPTIVLTEFIFTILFSMTTMTIVMILGIFIMFQLIHMRCFVNIKTYLGKFTRFWSLMMKSTLFWLLLFSPHVSNSTTPRPWNSSRFTDYNYVHKQMQILNHWYQVQIQIIIKISNTNSKWKYKLRILWFKKCKSGQNHL